MSRKLPALQFYPGDWRKDPGIQALDYESRGVWFEILLLMWESDDRGKLMLNGEAMPHEGLAQILGVEEAKLKQIVGKLEAFGVASRDPETGALINRRMVRDEAIHRAKVEAGRKGGRKSRPPAMSRPVEATPEADGKQERTSSSSSSTSTTHTPQFEEEVQDVFDLCASLRAARIGKTSGPPLKLTGKRASAIRARLRDGFSVADLQDCARGFYADNWEGRDDYLDPIYAFKNDDKVRRFRDQYRNGSRGRPEEDYARGSEVLEAMEKSP